MILITGATGQLGQATLDFLLARTGSENIAALVRNESKVPALKEKGIDVRIGDYDDMDALISAFKGVDKLFFVSGSDIVNRQEQHVNVIEAAKAAGVKHIIYTSFARKNETDTNPLGIVASSHIATDKIIKESGIPYTIMLNGLYADILPMFFGEKVLETGIFLPAGAGKAAYTSRIDIAEAAANILLTGGHENKEYIITNSENYSLNDAARILSDLSGAEVSYVNPSSEVYKSTLTGAGVPKEYIGLFSDFSEAISQGEFETTTSDLKQLLGRKPATLKDVFEKVYFSKN